MSSLSVTAGAGYLSVPTGANAVIHINSRTPSAVRSDDALLSVLRVWDLLRDLLFEAEQLKNIRLVLSCRAYDLEHDDRLRALLFKRTQTRRVDLQLLSRETVEAVLQTAGASTAKFSGRHFELLRTPLHLSVFLRGDPQSEEPATDLTQLYDRYWRVKRDSARARRPHAIRFEETLERLADALSERQTLSVPRDIFDAGGLAVDAEALASDHVLVFEANRCRFFHETFFDYTFARTFVAGGKRLLVDLLRPGVEQHLFRRGQIRQVLAYERGRDGGMSDYIRDLLVSPDVRIHLKKATLDWVGAQPEPFADEWSVLLGLLGERELIRAFIASPALQKGAGGLLHALDGCWARLPEEVLLIPERLIEEQKRQKGDYRSYHDMFLHDTSKLVMTLYQQSRAHQCGPTSDAFQTRCLDIIDATLLADASAIDEELKRFEQ